MNIVHTQLERWSNPSNAFVKYFAAQNMESEEPIITEAEDAVVKEYEAKGWELEYQLGGREGIKIKRSFDDAEVVEFVKKLGTEWYYGIFGGVPRVVKGLNLRYNSERLFLHGEWRVSIGEFIAPTFRRELPDTWFFDKILDASAITKNAYGMDKKNTVDDKHIIIEVQGQDHQYEARRISDWSLAATA